MEESMKSFKSIIFEKCAFEYTANMEITFKYVSLICDL